MYQYHNKLPGLLRLHVALGRRTSDGMSLACYLLIRLLNQPRGFNDGVEVSLSCIRQAYFPPCKCVTRTMSKLHFHSLQFKKEIPLNHNFWLHLDLYGQDDVKRVSTKPYKGPRPWSPCELRYDMPARTSADSNARRLVER